MGKGEDGGMGVKSQKERDIKTPEGKETKLQNPRMKGRGENDGLGSRETRISLKVSEVTAKLDIPRGRRGEKG